MPSKRTSRPAGKGRRGRRAGSSGNREAILAAARARFAAVGFDRATIRAIAADAGVDPALVMYFFGSKEQLFLAAIEIATRPVPAVLEPGRRGLGERLVRFYLDLWDSEETRDAVAAIVRSASSHEGAESLVRAFLGSQIFEPLAAELGSPEARLRAVLCGSQLVGLAVTRYLVAVEPLASLDREQLVAAVAPTLDRYLTGPLPAAASPAASPPG